MAVLEIILAIVCLLALVGVAVVWAMPEQPPTPETPEPDLAAPYREGLEAALRIQVVAQDLEQQMYAEAIRHAEPSPAPANVIRYPRGRPPDA
jgi:hypothetical protein